MTSLPHTFPQLSTKSLPASAYYLANYGMPHFSHTSLISSLTNPFIPSNILTLLKDELSNEKLASLKAPQLYDTASVNSFVSNLDFSNKSEQASSAQVTSSTSDTEAPSKSRNVIVKNEQIRKKKKELIKDDAYWERRRKNNDAAKRSRDSRRQKEDEVAIRAAVLEQENIQLRIEVERLKAETERLRMLMITPALLSSTPLSISANPEALLNTTIIRQPETSAASFISSPTSSSSTLLLSSSASSTNSLLSSSSPTSSILSQHC
uniref:BZIP domain-containing protein n=1 Tax=Syphacia muris TaxID=451379 RepID=A0A0N5AZ58_9BILA